MLKSAVIEEKKFKHSLGKGQTTHKGPSFDVNRKASSLWSFVASLKRISSTSDFIHIFSWFNKCIQPQVRGADKPRGQNFDVNRNLLSLRSFATSFKNIFSKSDLIHFFHDFILVYSLGAAADNPLGTKFWCQQEHLLFGSREDF